MEAGGKDCEEETLQTAFKKLRVDAESLPGAVSVPEALVPRAASRVCLDSGGSKPKLSCPKENWHGCMRKTSRGASRSQRRRRSKSPILHPPKFTYCSAATASALKPQRLLLPDGVEAGPSGDSRATLPPSSGSGPAQKEVPVSGSPGRVSPLTFGSGAGYETHSPLLQKIPAVIATAASPPGLEGGTSGDSGEERPEKSACEGAEPGAASASPGPAEAADFRALCELHSSISAETTRPPCSCSWRSSSSSSSPSDPAVEEGGALAAPGSEPRCQCGAGPRGWAGVEVYSFTGLRDVISECERSLPGQQLNARTLSTNPPTAPAASSSPSPSSSSSGSPRSCSEQARAYVDDITIEDLSGYMEFYLYIPKKMSHMAEMMYT